MRTHLSVKSAILVIGSSAFFSVTAAAQEPDAQVTVQQSPPVVQPVVQTPARPMEGERETITEKGGPSTGMLTSGLVMFGVSYGAAAVAGAASDADGRGDLFVPFAGPWMALDSYESSASKVFLVTDGVFQGLSGLLLIGAFLNPQERTITKTRTTQLHVAPSVSPEFLGLAAAGRF